MVALLTALFAAGAFDAGAAAASAVADLRAYTTFDVGSL
jgi:hypothetical protein